MTWRIWSSCERNLRNSTLKLFLNTFTEIMGFWEKKKFLSQLLSLELIRNGFLSYRLRKKRETFFSCPFRSVYFFLMMVVGYAYENQFSMSSSLRKKKFTQNLLQKWSLDFFLLKRMVTSQECTEVEPKPQLAFCNWRHSSQRNIVFAPRVKGIESKKFGFIKVQLR